MTNNLPTIDIKGKKYVLVSERVLAFNENFPNGSIETEILSPIDSKTIVVKVTVTPDVKNIARRFVGHSQAVIGQGMVNTTAALENAETSAVGRALGMMGIGVIESIASADEINKSLNAEKKSTVSAEECQHLDFVTRQSKKVGPNKDKWYKACNVCKTNGYPTFIGWSDAPTGNDLVVNENGSKSFGHTEFSEPH